MSRFFIVILKKLLTNSAQSPAVVKGLRQRRKGLIEENDVPKIGDDSMTVPKTGIGSNYVIWICMCITALGLGVVVLIKLRKAAARR